MDFRYKTGDEVEFLTLGNKFRGKILYPYWIYINDENAAYKRPSYEIETNVGDFKTIVHIEEIYVRKLDEPVNKFKIGDKVKYMHSYFFTETETEKSGVITNVQARRYEIKENELTTHWVEYDKVICKFGFAMPTE